MKINYPTFAFRNILSPTNGIVVMEDFEYMKLEMTCGGGMGGCHWKEYIKATELKPNTIIEVETIFGEKKTINTKYVVSGENLRCLIVKEDATPWRNYNQWRVDKYEVYWWMSLELGREYTFLHPNQPFGEGKIKDNIIARATYEDEICVNFNKY